MRTHKWILTLAALLTIGVAAGQTQLSIATGGTGGVYYPVGGGYAQVIDQFVDGYSATVEATNASVDNVAFISRGEADLALALGDTVLAAYAGTGRFGPEGNLPQLANLRALTVAYTNAVHIITVEGSGIESLADLRGKRVSVGAPGSGTELSAQNILDAVGITYDDFQVERLSANETGDALRDGTIDAGFWSGGVPTGAVLSLAESRQIKLVPGHRRRVRGGQRRQPDPDPVRLPGRRLPRHRGDRLDRHAEPADRGRPRWTRSSRTPSPRRSSSTSTSSARSTRRPTRPCAEAALASPIPLHAGAIRYFEEIGLTVPDRLKVD